MKNVRLEMNFKTEKDKKYKLGISEANELLSKDEVLESMNEIISQDVFEVESSSLKVPESARYVTTTITEIF